MIQRKKQRTAKIAFFSVIHSVYFQQFEGLEASIMGYHADTVRLVEDNQVTVIDYGIVGSNTQAYETTQRIQADCVDLIFCNMVSYATSSVFGPIVQNTNAPIILLALQPRRNLDYSVASTFMQLENDNICSVPEFTGVAIRYGKPVADVVIGMLYDDREAKQEIFQWCEIAKVLHDLKGARIGLMGHVLESMYDMHADPTAISAAFGVHVPLLEIDDIVREYEAVTCQEQDKKIKQILEEF